MEYKRRRNTKLVALLPTGCEIRAMSNSSIGLLVATDRGTYVVKNGKAKKFKLSAGEKH